MKNLINYFLIAFGLLVGVILGFYATLSSAVIANLFIGAFVIATGLSIGVLFIVLSLEFLTGKAKEKRIK